MEDAICRSPQLTQEDFNTAARIERYPCEENLIIIELSHVLQAQHQEQFKAVSGKLIGQTLGLATS